MERVAPNSNFVEHSTEIIQQSKIRAPLPIEFYHTRSRIETHEIFFNK